MLKIKVQDIIPVDDPIQYKLHLACRNKEGISPLDEYVADPERWVGWNEWRGNKNDWTREFVFSVMEFYPRYDSWLFGGIFRVIERHDDCYQLEELEKYKKFVGRVLLSFHRYQGMRWRAYYLENYIQEFEIVEILPSVYRGESFPGVENICHDFHILESIFKSKRSDWKAALSNIKGVYVISDKHNGKQYVGSAYSDTGIWSRWACYIDTGHGVESDELTKLIKTKGINYARKNFRFSLIEIMPMSVDKNTVIARESHWKKALLSIDHGYNLK